MPQTTPRRLSAMIAGPRAAIGTKWALAEWRRIQRAAKLMAMPPTTYVRVRALEAAAADLAPRKR